jgi:hypothetical protein
MISRGFSEVKSSSRINPCLQQAGRLAGVDKLICFAPPAADEKG